MTRQRIAGVLVLVLWACLGMPAQETEAPPAAPSGNGQEEPAAAPPAEAAEETAPEQEPPRPDTQPLGGLHDLGLGSEGGQRSYVTPRLDYNQNLTNRAGYSSSGVTAISNASGSLELQRQWRRSLLTGTYVLGGTFSPGNSEYNGWFTRASVSYAMNLHRWNLSFSDSLSYLPESAFGFGSVYGIGGPGVITPGRSSEETLVTGRNTSVSNTFGAQAQYMINGRTSMYMTGSYSLLRHPGSADLVDSNSWYGGVGVDRQLTASDTIGVSYQIGMMRFEGGTRDVNSHSVYLNYGRRLTGKLALQLGGGPQWRTSDDSGTGSDSKLAYSMRAGVVYALGATNVSGNYFRTTTPGSGLFLGAATDSVQASVSRRLTRTWAGGLNLGLSRNTSFHKTGPEQRVNSQFGGVSLSRPLNREMSVVIGYAVQHQTTSTACTGCEREFLRHSVRIGVQWNFRPFPISWF